jgi:hypothetical protein
LQKTFCELTTDNEQLLQVSRKGYVGGADQAHPDNGTGIAPASAGTTASRLRERTFIQDFLNNATGQTVAEQSGGDGSRKVLERR